MNLRDRRAALAFGLTLLALAVPCIAWYLVGSREIEHQAADLTDNAQQAAHDTAVRLAQQLTLRLNKLREAEATRPFYHYQSYYHDPQGASEGASVVASPLATGPKDPLVQIYFQVDAATGRLTLPTAQAELQQYDQPQSRHARADEQLYLQRQLERGLASILFAVRGESLPQKQLTVGQRVEVLEQRAWAQNVDAQELYSSLKNRSAQAQPPAALAPTNDTGQVQVFVGALKWRTVYVAGSPALVALREITTPQGAVLQGFLLSAAGLADYFKTAGLPAKLLPGVPAGDLEAAVAVADEPWRIVVDAGAAQAAAAQQVRDLRRGFFAIFLGGVGIATLAGLGVVWLVWQTERFARQRSQFAASAAHELRTPLAGLRIYSDMLAEGLGDPGRSKDYARRVADEAERLGRVVANVLGFTRLERGTLRVQPGPGDLAGAVRESIARQQPALEAAGAHLEVSIGDNLPAVKFDRDAVAQILQNLLDNAERHTRTAVDRRIHVALAPQNGHVALTVADRGPGVPAHVRRHLFQAFTRGNQTDAPAGLGLGLVLVKALAEAQGATIACCDNDGGGAKFVVTFPA